jgi:hypothetical protein
MAEVLTVPVGCYRSIIYFELHVIKIEQQIQFFEQEIQIIQHLHIVL